MTTVTGLSHFEVEVGVSGTFVPGRPATPPSYSSGGDPPEPDTFEDVAVVSLGAIRRVAGKWETIDLLAGVDTKSAAYQQLAANILAFIDDATETLLAEVEE